MRIAMDSALEQRVLYTDLRSVQTRTDAHKDKMQIQRVKE